MKNRLSILFIITPLVLTAYTHLWNPIGFPTFHADEGIYISRGMHFLKGLGIQELPFYDHPYFGQIFLAGVFWIIGFPNSLHPSVGNLHSIDTLFMVPRGLMGLLAVVDSFLIYKISERRYDRSVAFMASIIFAVMPITWLTRRIFLDSIQLPFLLSSILFADYTNNLKYNRKVSMTLFSGTFMGLAIFTKIPVFTIIPVVVFLIYYNNGKNWRVLLRLWLIPVILIPMIWPAYALSIGEFRLWVVGVFFQLHRISQPLLDPVNGFFKDDPILLLLGIAGLVFAAIKRDYFLLLWVIPFLIFLYFIGYVSLFHFIPLIPPLCIAVARLIADLSMEIRNKKFQQLLQFFVISGITIFGLTCVTMLVTTDVNSSHFRAAAFVAQYLPYTGNSKTDKITIISDPFYSWIPQYVLGKNHIYQGYYTKLLTQKVLLVVDWGFRYAMSTHDRQAERLQNIYYKTHPIMSIV
ncbi:MAG: glycosyltransferase family 39 protein, partial [Candidatus Nitrosopolaris sp.]